MGIHETFTDSLTRSLARLDEDDCIVLQDAKWVNRYAQVKRAATGFLVEVTGDRFLIPTEVWSRPEREHIERLGFVVDGGIDGGNYATEVASPSEASLLMCEVLDDVMDTRIEEVVVHTGTDRRDGIHEYVVAVRTASLISGTLTGAGFPVELPYPWVVGSELGDQPMPFFLDTRVVGPQSVQVGIGIHLIRRGDEAMLARVIAFTNQVQPVLFRLEVDEQATWVAGVQDFPTAFIRSALLDVLGLVSRDAWVVREVIRETVSATHREAADQ